MSVVRAAVVQSAPVAFDPEATLGKVDALVAQAAEEDAQLVVLPEAFLSGYPKGMDFGVRVGSRSAEGREQFRRYARGAIEVPGPVTRRLGKIARNHGVWLVVGVTERKGGTLFGTALFLGPDGSLQGLHRKLVPTAMERAIWGQGDGSTLAAVDTPFGRLGAAICWESYMPLYRATLYAKGVELYCAPTVDDRDSWIPTMQHVAVEGRCFVLSACQFATRADYPSRYPTSYGDDPRTEVIRGGSCMVDPFGELLAGPVYGEEAVLVAELDRDQLGRARFDLDVSGHYARHDVFKLQVDETPRGVEFTRDEPAP